MTLLLPLVFVIIGLVLLVKGADWLVSGASALAFRLGVSALVIGLTVVGFGTSSPELVTSLLGGSTIAVGNVVGSNLMNLGLILGLTAMISPLRCQSSFLRFEMPLMALLGPVFWYLAGTDGMFTRLEGITLFAGLLAFLVVSFKRGKSGEDIEVAREAEELVSHPLSAGKAVLFVLVGLAALIVGGELLVRGARTVAELMGVPERIIALTLIAGGTSLPELATCIVAARKGEGDIALGNIVGSNIFNILGVLGVVAAVNPITVPEGSLGIEVPAMVGIQFLCIPIMLTAKRITRGEGGLLFACYAAYTVVLFSSM
jgi:cation:H+ antiporter